MPPCMSSVLTGRDGQWGVLRGAVSVAVMKAADLRHADDATVARRSDRARDRRVLVEREMGPRMLMVFDVRVQDTAQPALIPNDDVVEALTANGSDQPFGIRVGSRQGVLRAPDRHDPP
jgi:hypothetical protein